jgi:hypothetical protein
LTVALGGRGEHVTSPPGGVEDKGFSTPFIERILRRDKRNAKPPQTNLDGFFGFDMPPDKREQRRLIP